jgi:chromate reductase, NAD(P)H dehydrogenase (quinone)
LLISGSTRPGSTNAAVLHTIVDLTAHGFDEIESVSYDGIADLPAFRPDADDDAPDPNVAAWRRALSAADAVLFCAPEYAGTLPGSLKNALDWTVGTGEFFGRPVAWINAAALGRGAGAAATLRLVLTYVGAVIIEPATVQLPVGRDTVGPDGLIADPLVRSQLTDVVCAIRDFVNQQVR